MEKWYDDIFNIIQECDEHLDEALKRKVIRRGKLIRKTFCKKGQKALKGRCVAMRSSERSIRKRTARRGAMKRKGKMARILKKRAKAMKKRRSFGLKTMRR